jgi:1-acyl-sn-glycerol-3-phosphate acyltransferase
VEGTEKIPAQAGIVMCKNQSTWETLALPFLFHPLTWVLKREVIRLPVFGWALGLLEPIAINRGSRHRAFQQVVEQGRDRLEKGRWVAVFPEGTRVPPGSRGRYLPGAAYLATRTGRPVVPVAHNAGEHWPRRRVAKIPGTIRVRIGPPIESAGKKPAELMAEVQAWIEAQMPEISDFGYPGTPYRPDR